MSQEEVYEAAGFGRPVERGSRPAIVIVDFTYGFTDKQYPTAADMSTEIAMTRRIADVARDAGYLVIFTTISYHPSEVGNVAWLRKASGMSALLEGSRLVEIDETTGVRPEDLILTKKGASAFHGTSLASLLTAACVDTVVVTGATTSGCVRATVVDAVQSGFNVLVPRDCCADRAQSPHDASLYDIQQKYADVTDAVDVMNWLGSLRAHR
ncbi:isochorismatase family protein [Shinella sp. G-2]|uniref:isochorismatase family protein n=1 Tax=Rhizobiaceae TaxID=82115 RepID=UPI003D015845